jgi:heptose I phosphotransferase
MEPTTMMSSQWRRLFHGSCWQESCRDWVAVTGPDWTRWIMDLDVTDDFHAKQGRSTERWLAKNPNGQLAVYLKRHYRLPWWRGLLATLFPFGNWSPAFHERHNLNWAIGQGFRVPRPLAAAEFVGPAFRLRSVLAVEELTGMLPLHQAIPLAQRCLEPPVFVRWKRSLVQELARVAGELHRRRRYHKDFYLCHFYVPRSMAEAPALHAECPFHQQLYMIDLHRLAHHRMAWPIWQWKDLAQLLYSSDVAGVTPRDRVRFWRLYRRRKPRSVWLRWAEWFIRLKWQRYHNHNQKRRRRLALNQEQNKVAA